ncbi:hypothetical protein GGP41_010605 [Bipolaris sorokiniana]|uniref:Uncharacterized protein n=1 Tax=Cochliobolus sativus TaxID=45130 RepID=A0A8H5ZKL2_COCSA|nr:hypothetical protein GGP41_010605 [Bipolaris sorokiniana]
MSINWEQQYDPVKNKGMDFTNLLFAAEDMIMVTDITCSSACSISTDLMRKCVGVKTVALGGQPRKDIT